MGCKINLLTDEKGAAGDSEINCSKMELGNTSPSGAFAVQGILHTKRNLESSH